MQLDSYLEIFTTMYGWAFANIIGEIITGTGLVIIPFAIIIFQGWREAKEQGLQAAGVLPLLERVQTRLVIALFVMSVCFATTPITSLHHTNLSYTPPSNVLNTSPETGSRDGGTGSGFDQAMLKVIRKHPRTQAMPFIMATGRSDKEQVKEAISFGVNNYIIKPFDASTMKKRIEAVIGALS